MNKGKILPILGVMRLISFLILGELFLSIIFVSFGKHPTIKHRKKKGILRLIKENALVFTLFILRK